MQPQKLCDVLTDIHLADGSLKANYILGDSASKIAPHLYKQVYERHQIDSATLQKSLNYYTDHPEKLEYVYTLINEKLSKLESGIEK